MRQCKPRTLNWMQAKWPSKVYQESGSVLAAAFVRASVSRLLTAEQSQPGWLMSPHSTGSVCCLQSLPRHHVFISFSTSAHRVALCLLFCVCVRFDTFWYCHHIYLTALFIVSVVDLFAFFFNLFRLTHGISLLRSSHSRSSLIPLLCLIKETHTHINSKTKVGKNQLCQMTLTEFSLSLFTQPEIYAIKVFFQYSTLI